MNCLGVCPRSSSLVRSDILGPEDSVTASRVGHTSPSFSMLTTTIPRARDGSLFSRGIVAILRYFSKRFAALNGCRHSCVGPSLRHLQAQICGRFRIDL